MRDARYYFFLVFTSSALFLSSKGTGLAAMFIAHLLPVTAADYDAIGSVRTHRDPEQIGIGYGRL